MMTNTKRTTGVRTVRKPHKDFPLFPHATGRWAKKVKGKLEYFGSTKDDPDGERALLEWLDQKDNILAGRPRRIETTVLTVRELSNKLLNSKNVEMRNGLVKPISLRRWMRVCERIIKFFGKDRAVESLGPDDFQAFAETLVEYSPSTRRDWFGYTRGLFNFAYNDEQRLIAQPVLFGRAFRKPKQSRERLEESRRSFSAEEIRAMLSIVGEWSNGEKRRVLAGARMRAIILLAINCGFGNNDCGTLKMRALDLISGWHFHARPKTGVRRRCPLWPETIDAIQDWLKVRTKPKSEAHSDLLFISATGLPITGLTRQSEERLSAGKVFQLGMRNSAHDPMTKILTAVGIRQRGLSFYSFRHTFETIGGAVKDQVAVDLIMGHITEGMGTTYRDSIDDERLRAVTDHVRAWLFGKETQDA
jgi:integrase